MTNLIGKSLGRYHILEQLGEGGMAIVYLAHDEKLDRKVAIKVIKSDKNSDKVYLGRFNREAKTLAILNHPNIVHINDYGEKDGFIFLVMEYIQGETLRKKMGKAMHYTAAAKLLAPIAHALAYAHHNNIIHRDLKPSNILISQDGKPMLADFGIAKILEYEETLELTSTGMGIGTPAYMAPEQWNGETTVFTDQYALGVILFEIITGQKLHSGKTPAELYKNVTQDQIRRPKSINASLPQFVEDVILRALSKHPNDRFHSMGEFASILESISKGQKIRTSRKLRISPSVITLIIGVLLFTLIFFRLSGI